MSYSNIVNSATTVLVEFYASWCPHCQRMMPVVETVKKQVGDTVKVYQFDIDQQRDYADENNIQSIPTFILYRNGKEVWRKTGEMTAAEIVDDIKG